MTDAELRDELVTLLLAGHETTATSVAWAIERLVRHPDKLRAAARPRSTLGRGRLGGVHDGRRQRDAAGQAGGADRGEDAPAGAAGGRAPAADGHARGAVDLPDQPQPARVRAARRSSARSASSTGAPETFSWIPFGGGIRRCIGASFALLEMKLILRTMLRELEPRVPGRGPQMARRRVEPPAGDHAGAGRGRAGGVGAEGAPGRSMMGAASGRPGVRARAPRGAGGRVVPAGAASSVELDSTPR